MIYVLAILSAILYRLGGTGGAWWRNTKMRDLGCSFCVLAGMYHLDHTPSWWWLLSFALMWIGLSSYHSWFKRLIGEDSSSEFWYSYLLHGLFIGLALYPMYTNYLTVVRAIALGALMATSVWITDPDWDEGLRGMYIVLTLYIL